jgi:hypothetical protein
MPLPKLTEISYKKNALILKTEENIFLIILQSYRRIMQKNRLEFRNLLCLTPLILLKDMEIQNQIYMILSSQQACTRKP